MEVKIAEAAGFCFGVKRAVELVYRLAQGDVPVYTYGSIIHNEVVVKDLEQKGVRVIHSPQQLKDKKEGIVVIRSHGVSEKVEKELAQGGLKVMDATCPFVKKIHTTVMQQENEGRRIIIFGDPKHPEVEGICGWCKKEPVVIQNTEQARAFCPEKAEKYCIVSQTTFNYKKFKDLVEIFEKKSYDILALNTICNATEERQSQTRQLARDSEAMIVIGGKESSNTQKLYEICKKECENTYYIQTLVDLDMDAISSYRNVGITAGASTPNNIIKEVQIACQKAKILNNYSREPSNRSAKVRS